MEETFGSFQGATSCLQKLSPIPNTVLEAFMCYGRFLLFCHVEMNNIGIVNI